MLNCGVIPRRCCRSQIRSRQVGPLLLGMSARLYRAAGVGDAPLRVWRLQKPRSPSGLAVTKPPRPFGSGGYENPTPPTDRMRNPRRLCENPAFNGRLRNPRK
jgi:hypothetical protein